MFRSQPYLYVNVSRATVDIYEVPLISGVKDICDVEEPINFLL